MEGNPCFFHRTHIPSFFDHSCEIGTIKSAVANVFWRNDAVLSNSLVWSSWVLNCFLPWVNCELAVRRRFNHTRCFRAVGCWQPLGCNSAPKSHRCQKTAPLCSQSLTLPESKSCFSKKGKYFLLITLNTGSRTRNLREQMKSTSETIVLCISSSEKPCLT